MRVRATVFEPATDERLFHPPIAAMPGRPKRLLFYARPTNTRNIFGLALMALRRASAHPALAGWQFLAIGGRGSVPPMSLEGGHKLQPAPWMDYEGYAQSLREADVLLCPMLSPHTSYPVLEMAASGGLSVTNTFTTKTQAALEEVEEAELEGILLERAEVADARAPPRGQEIVADVRLGGVIRAQPRRDGVAKAGDGTESAKQREERRAHAQAVREALGLGNPRAARPLVAHEIRGRLDVLQRNAGNDVPRPLEE